MAKKKIDFEKSLARLEEISELLESDEISVDELVSLYEEGVKLANLCSSELKNAELKIQQIDKTYLENE